MRKMIFKPIRILLPIVVLILFLGAATHKFYVSTTVVNYKEATGVLQVTSQLFIEDLELALKLSNPKLRLFPDSDSLQVHALLENYLKHHLLFKMEDSILPHTFLGRKYKNDLVVCYLEVPIHTAERVVLENRIFFDLYEEQKNIIHFKKGSKRKSFMLHLESPMIEILLKD